MAKPIVGVMGPGEDASLSDREIAHQLGARIARQGWILLTGGRNTGVMEAASESAHAAGGIVVGILPGKDKKEASAHLDIAILTNLGEARNAVNVLTADVIVGIGMNPGTASEIAFAIKAEKPVLLLNCPPEGVAFFSYLKKVSPFYRGVLQTVPSVEECIEEIEKLLSSNPILTEGEYGGS